MRATLINPNLVVQRNDPLTTGIVYLPISLAYVASALRQADIPTTVIDAYGSNPRQARDKDKFFIFGLRTEEIVTRIPPETTIIFVFANQLLNHVAIIEIIRAVKQSKPSIPLVILENTQAVTAYSLKEVAQEFYAAGADYILTGEAEQVAVDLTRALAGDSPQDQENLRSIKGLGSPTHPLIAPQTLTDLDQIPFPAWDLFPLENYWALHFSHGPLSNKRYLSLLTSRGCPYACRFCIAQATNHQHWRPRSAKNVVDEIEYFQKKFAVNEFHLEDLNPTVSQERIRAICVEIIRRELRIIWKIAAGTKIETIHNTTTLELLAQAGCQYLSFSPETGSETLRQKMNKPFDLESALALVPTMNRLQIRCQACFVLGFPDETREDRKKTRQLIKELTRLGVDEIALFIISPAPGSAIYQNFDGYSSLSELNFTPTWRKDYAELNRFRFHLYLAFLFWKLLYHPDKIFRQIVNFSQRRFETKMEMVPYRALRLMGWARKAVS